jgi:hypothetical protein
MSVISANCYLKRGDDRGGLRWTGEVEIDQEAVESIAESLSRLYRCGWNKRDITVSSRDGECNFLVRGQIGDRHIQSEGSTLAAALEQALTDVRVQNLSRSGGVAV